jgi:hypothetical protein
VSEYINNISDVNLSSSWMNNTSEMAKTKSIKSLSGKIYNSDIILSSSSKQIRGGDVETIFLPDDPKVVQNSNITTDIKNLTDKDLNETPSMTSINNDLNNLSRYEYTIASQQGGRVADNTVMDKDSSDISPIYSSSTESTKYLLRNLREYGKKNMMNTTELLKTSETYNLSDSFAISVTSTELPKKKLKNNKNYSPEHSDTDFLTPLSEYNESVPKNNLFMY